MRTRFGIDHRTARQLVREFWIPSALAAFWTAFRLWNRQNGDVTVADTIATFGPAFFLVSWATGQIVRVRKQARTERSLRTVEERLVAVTANLERTSQDIIGHVGGGDSFCYLSFYSDGHPAIMAVHQGNHPLYSVSARAVDVDGFKATPPPERYSFARDHHIEIGDLPPNSTKPLDSEIAQRDCRSINIFFSARNGFWTQLVRRNSAHATASAAIRVQRNKPDGALEILFERIPPGLNAAEITW